MSSVRRVSNYLRQTGRAKMTAKQERRNNKKNRERWNNKKNRRDMS